MRRKTSELTKQILEVLENTPASRDSDQYLTLCIWNRYYPKYIKDEPTGEMGEDGVEKVVKYVALKDIMQLPREDNVKRIRAKIQNEQNKFLPTSWVVAKQRKINETVWRDWSRTCGI